MDDIHADVVVIGSGAGGGMAAFQLAARGLRVLVIERGDWFQPASSTARHADWETRTNSLGVRGFPADPTIASRRGAVISPHHKAAQSAGRRGQPVGFTHRNPFRYHRVYGVGGSTLHYEGEAHRFPPHAFRPASIFGTGVDWPLEYWELAPWYERAERLLHVSGDPDNPFKAARDPYPLPPHPPTARRRWVDEGAARLGWRHLPNSLALPSRATPDSGPCRHSGLCHRGCPFGAKFSTDRLLQKAMSSGYLEMVTGARVTRLESQGARVTAAHFIAEGRERVARGRQFILAAGAVETPRLLLASDSGKFPRGLGNGNDQIGRHFMETVFIARGFQADRDIQSWKGPPQEARIWDFNRPDMEQGIHGFTLGTSAGNDRFRGPMGFALRTEGIGSAHKAAVRAQFGRSIWIIGVTDHQPDAGNRLSLAAERDDAGVPKVEVITDYGELELATLVEMKRRIGMLADACGAAESLETFSSYSQPSTTHVGGTCRMGNDPETSATDGYGRLHEIENLHIADGAVLPGQGMGDSPSLTIQALALRTASRIADKNL